MDLWFGDSWPIGSELGTPSNKFDKTIFPNAVVSIDNPLKAFPHFVSLYRKQPYINFACGGSSIDFSLNQLIKFCSTTYDTNVKYTAFLCTTSQLRGYGESHLLDKIFHYRNKQSKTEHDIYIYDSIISITAFYSICKMHQIECYIIPVFCNLLIPKKMDSLALFKESLLCDTSLVEKTFNVNYLDAVEKGLARAYSWIKPNQCMHPNFAGHRKLAYKVIELLESH